MGLYEAAIIVDVRLRGRVSRLHGGDSRAVCVCSKEADRIWGDVAACNCSYEYSWATSTAAAADRQYSRTNNVA